MNVLDPCCGSRMFWFNRDDQRALFGDVRDEDHILCDGRALNVHPNIRMDFRSLPFVDKSFNLVVFDPPHLIHAGKKSWLRLKYGSLEASSWKIDIERGFRECFRVLKNEGTLIFKWNEAQIKISDVLSCTQEKPLFGHVSGKRSNTHWMTFIKVEPK